MYEKNGYDIYILIHMFFNEIFFLCSNFHEIMVDVPFVLINGENLLLLRFYGLENRCVDFILTK